MGQVLAYQPKEKKYGSEYKTVLVYKNIKFIKQKSETSLTSPMETMSKGRIYVVIDNQDSVKHIVFFDKQNKRNRQIDVGHHSHIINGKLEKNHTHKGYFHSEGGTFIMTQAEKKLVDKVINLWYNRS